MSHPVVVKVGFRGPKGDSGATVPVVTGFVVEDGQYVLILSDGSKIIGPPAGGGEPTDSRLTGATWPSAPQTMPANMIPADASDFLSAESWNALSGLVIEDGRAKWDGTSVGTSVMQTSLPQPAVQGRQYGMLLGNASFTSGNAIMGAQPPSTNATGSGSNGPGHWSRQLTATGNYPTARISVAAGSNLEIDYLRMYDLTNLLAKKWRIVFVYSQSNWVAGTVDASTYAVDLPEPRAVQIPSRSSGPLGTTLDGEGIGVPMLMCDPVVHLSGTAVGGPSGAFSRTFCDGLRDDEVLLYVAAGYSGGGRTQPGDPWYHDGDGPDGEAWTNLLKQVDALVSRAPAGSTVAGCLFCQGEADLADITGDQHTETIRADFEFLRERWGNFPVVVNEIGHSDTNIPTVANMIASQAKLDSNSGDPLALPLCRYIPRPEGATFQDDNLHYDQASQRVRGSLAAEALLEMNYGGPKP